jgi:hypothetical protein
MTAENSAKTAIGRPFKKGESGNPGGRPRTAELSKAIRAYLESSLPGNGHKTRLDALIERLYKKDPKTLLAYGFGKPVETHELEGIPERMVFVPVNLDVNKIIGNT